MGPRSKFTIAATGAAALLLLSGCQSAEGGPSDTGGDTVTIGLAGTPPIFISTVLQVAQDQGFFEDHGVDVSLRPFTTSVDVSRAIQSGEIEGGFVTTQGAAAIRGQGGSLVGILGFENPSYTLASTDPSVQSCEDVAGKTVATDSPGTPLNTALIQILASCDLTLDDVNSVAVNGVATLDAMIADQAQIAVLHPEQIELVRERRPIEAIETVANVDPLSHYLLLDTTDEQLVDAAARETWVSIVAATVDAIDFIYDEANSEVVAQVASDVTKRPLAITTKALPAYKELEFWPQGSDGLTRERVEASIGAAIAAGTSESAAPTYEELVDPSVYEDAVGG